MAESSQSAVDEQELVEEAEDTSPSQDDETPADELAQSEEDQAEGDETEAEETDDDSDDEDADDEGLVDFQFQNQNFRVPSQLAEGIKSLRAASTQKMQEASARQKALDERETALQQADETTEQELTDRALIAEADKAIEKYGQIDWDAYEAQDPQASNQHWRRFQQIKEARQQATERLDTAKRERTEKAQSEYSKRVQETEKFAAQNIRGWNDDLANKVMKNALDAGVEMTQLRQVMSPQVISILYQAYVGSRALAKQAKAPAKTSEAAPTRKVNSRSQPSRGPSEKDSAEDWIRKRNAEVERRREAGLGAGASA